MPAMPTAIDARPTHVAHAWWMIPKLAGILLWRHWPALLFWFFAQRVAYDLLLQVSIRLAEASILLSYAAIAMLIVTQLVGVIAMLLVLRPSLPTQGVVRAPESQSQSSWLNVLAVALLPFFAYYASWGLLDGIKRDFMLSYLSGVSFENRESLADILGVHGLWIALLIAWAVRAVAKRRAAATGHGAWAIIATVCEAYWVFVGVSAVAKGISMAKDWWQARVVYATVAQWWENPFLGLVSLAPLKRMLDPAWDFLSTAASAVVMPLIWLAITAIVYGLDLRRRQRLGDIDVHARVLARQYKGLHVVWRKLADKASAGWTSKGVPVANSLRLVLRAGLPALLTLCLCWQLLATVDAWTWRVVTRWIGARQWQEWQVLAQPLLVVVNGPLSLRPALLTELLRIVLLAATFDRALAHLPRATRATGPD
jgi:hypothetical protein